MPARRGEPESEQGLAHLTLAGKEGSTLSGAAPRHEYGNLGAWKS